MLFCKFPSFLAFRIHINPHSAHRCSQTVFTWRTKQPLATNSLREIQTEPISFSIISLFLNTCLYCRRTLTAAIFFRFIFYSYLVASLLVFCERIFFCLIATMGYNNFAVYMQFIDYLSVSLIILYENRDILNCLILSWQRPEPEKQHMSHKIFYSEKAQKK